MITQPTRPRLCLSCGVRRATRWVRSRPDSRGRWRRLFLCDVCPGPREIDRAAHRIAWRWSDTERACRYYGCPVDQVVYRTRYDFRDHVCTVAADDRGGVAAD